MVFRSKIFLPIFRPNR